MIGAGIIGTATAWHLIRRGHRVLLLEPGGPQDLARQPGTASHAALGLLMAQTFQRGRGRAWRLRQRSLALWQEWRQQLLERGYPLSWRSGLLALAADLAELERKRQLVAERRAMGLPLEFWERDRLEALDPPLPKSVLGGLYSPCDGQIDPGQAIAALRADALAQGVEVCSDSAAAVESSGSSQQRRWRVRLAQGGVLEGESAVLAAGLAGWDLLRPLGFERRLEPVLGQALDLELSDGGTGDAPAWRHWPGAVSLQGINLVPRPDLPGGGHLWLGATLEPGRLADPAAMAHVRDLHGFAPGWLQRARQVNHWQGLRPRPVGRSAPLLEEIAPGLLLTLGHYRNGVLLAPATAEWVAERIEAAA